MTADVVGGGKSAAGRTKVSDSNRRRGGRRRSPTKSVLLVLVSCVVAYSVVSFHEQEQPLLSVNTNVVSENLVKHVDEEEATRRKTTTVTTPTLPASSTKWPVQCKGLTRKKAQRKIMDVLRGKARMLSNKTLLYSYEDVEEADGHCEDKNSDKEVIVDAFKNRNEVGYSHMAMLSPLPRGSFYRWILVWQASKGIEGTADMHLKAMFSDDLKKWSEAIVVDVKKNSKNAVWAPVLHLDEMENTLWLFFSESVKCLRLMSPQNRWSPGGNINALSTSDGISWTKPKTLITSDSESGNPKVIANKLVVHPKSKNWVLPYWGEASTAKGCRSGHPTISGVLISKDKGHTWHSHGKVHPRHGRVIEGTVAVLSDKNTILQLWRSKSGFLMQSQSSNGGFSWSVPKKRTDLKNPDSKASLTHFYVNNSNKHLVALAFNDASSGRKKLSLSVSKSDGKTWTKLKEIEPGKSGVHFHYPTVAADPFVCKLRLVVAYSYMRRVGASGWGSALKQAKFGGIKVATVSLPQSMIHQ